MDEQNTETAEDFFAAMIQSVRECPKDWEMAKMVLVVERFDSKIPGNILNEVVTHGGVSLSATIGMLTLGLRVTDQAAKQMKGRTPKKSEKACIA